MVFKVKKTEDGKFGLYNETKKEMTKRAFKTKEAAEKMAQHYMNFSTMRKTKKVEPEEPKKKIVRKKKVEPEVEEE